MSAIFDIIWVAVAEADTLGNAIVAALRRYLSPVEDLVYVLFEM